MKPARQLRLPFPPGPPAPRERSGLEQDLMAFREFDRKTAQDVAEFWPEAGAPVDVPVYVNEFWTSRQRAAHSLHEVSYRACFKPQLPRFFITRLTAPGERVYDPFMGRGTTLLEAALLGRKASGCDASPLSGVLAAPRLAPPAQEDVARRLQEIPLEAGGEGPEDLLAFYHPDTLGGICALRSYLLAREKSGTLDAVDAWIRMVALNRLTGHSPGFLSVYTLPPNQAVSAQAQRKINLQRGQTPPRRDLRKILLKKSAALLKDCDEAARAALRRAAPVLLTGDAASTPGIRPGSVRLVVTSPPFLDVVDYAADNWLRCWFLGVDPDAIHISLLRKLPDWQAKMTEVFRELRRVLAPGGHVAFEVGEVRGGKIRLEDAVVPAALRAGLEPVLILINSQKFTKTANCWGVDNNLKGTNTNRVVLLRKPSARTGPPRAPAVSSSP